MAASDPAKRAAAITPSDATDLETPTRGIYIGVTGDVTVDLEDSGTTILFKGAVAGSVLPVEAKRVRATGTTATNLVALW